MPIRKIQKRRLPDVVVEQLAAAVLKGEFVAGERLPAERELAARFGVSRNVVREAVNNLRSRGLLVTHQGSGSQVSNKVHKPVSDLMGSVLSGQVDGERLLLELRGALEVDVARLAAERASADEVAGLEDVLNAYDRTGEDLDACAELDVAFHRTLALASHNNLFGLVLASLDDLLVKTRRKALARSGVATASLSHRRILDAVKSRQGTAAAAAMRMHLSETMDRLAGSGGKSERRRKEQS
jgi:GntR family transcriptional repressor for pyruvate dehydrogenase complex